jgi:hypothetical protein
MIQTLNNHLESRPKSLNPYRRPLIKVATLRLAAGYIIVDTLLSILFHQRWSADMLGVPDHSVCRPIYQQLNPAVHNTHAALLKTLQHF